MENNPSASSGRGNNFFSGFLLGALIGAAAVFLFGTKKGKRILKAISEEGSGNISRIVSKLEKSVDLEGESLDDEPSFAEASTFAPASVDKSAGKGTDKIKEEIIKEEKPKVRRFFKGISRHVN